VKIEKEVLVGSWGPVAKPRYGVWGVDLKLFCAFCFYYIKMRRTFSTYLFLLAGRLVATLMVVVENDA